VSILSDDDIAIEVDCPLHRHANRYPGLACDIPAHCVSLALIILSEVNSVISIN
jgi:hypothetical protein